MQRMRILLLGLVIALSGCDFNIFQQAGGFGASSGNVADVAPKDIADPNDPALDSPAIVEGAIRLRITNVEDVGAQCKVAMQLAGREVHFSFRRIPGGNRVIVIGPDRTDKIVIDATFEGASPVRAEQQILRIGEDFFGGEIVDVSLRIPREPIIEPPPEPNESEPNEPPPPAELSVAIVGLDLDARVNPGAVIEFGVTAANFSAAGRISAFADPDSDPGNGNEIPIVSDATAATQQTMSWDTSETAPGVYSIYAVLDDGDRSVRFGPAAGHVIVNALPMMDIVVPADGSLANVSEWLTVEWAGEDPDDDASVDVFLDSDTNPDNGNEFFVATALSEDDASTRTFLASVFGLKRGQYYVGGTMDDGLFRRVVYGPRICVTAGRTGLFAAADLPIGEATSIEGEVVDPNDPNEPNFFFSESRQLGYSIDSSLDLDGDGVADLLIGDPNAFAAEGFGFGFGAVYFKQGFTGVWQRRLDVGAATSFVEGEMPGSRAGASVAFASDLDPNSSLPGQVLIGAQFEDFSGTGFKEGAARFFDGEDVTDPSDGQFWFEDGTYMHGDVKDEHAGRSVARLDDINDDGWNDIAIGSPGWNGNRGRVTVVFGGYGLPSGSLDDVGALGAAGVRIYGAAPGDLTGEAIARAGQFSEQRAGASGSDFLIGAPGANDSAGRVYLVFGASINGAEVVDLGDPNEWSGITFYGEEPPSIPTPREGGSVGAGGAIATLDVNGDGRRDILIGAQGIDGGRGRVYLIYNLATNPLPQTVSLGDVGVTIPGVRIDGAAIGDFFGWSIANAGDIDGDGFEDFAIGAPFAADFAGAVYVIYGGQTLAGAVSAADIGTCGLHGWSLEGDREGEMLGFSVSGGGDLDGNGLPDVTAGSPGFTPPNGEIPIGRAHLIFSKPVLPPVDDGPR